MINKFFSLPIILGIIAGFIFPFKALELIYLNNVLLFLLMLANGLVVDWSLAFKWSKPRARETGLFLALLFLVFPMILINLSHYLLHDENYLLGFALSCIAPTAFVAPYFCKIRGGNSESAVVNIFSSTLLFPIVSAFYIKYFLSVQHFLDIGSIVLIIFLITILPLILSGLLNRWVPALKRALAPGQSYINSFLLAALMFVLCGSSFNKLRLSHFLEPEMIYALLLLLILDFGVYYILRWMLAAKNSPSGINAETQAISVSLRNLAIPAGLLLSLQPKASIIPCLGLVVHCFFFQWLSRSKK